MQRRRRILFGWLLSATAAAGVLAGGDRATAQTSPPLVPHVIPQAQAAALDETAPRLTTTQNGQVLRVWQREGDPRAGGGSVLLAAAAPQDTWKTLLEIRPTEDGVSARDADLAMGPTPNDIALVYRWWRNSPRAKDLRIARSTDGGKTWSQSTATIDTAGKSFDPRAAWSNGRGLVVVWSDERRQNRLFDVYARYSPDGGATWEPEQLLSRFAKNGPTDLYNQARLVSDGKGRLWTVWIGVRGTKSALFMNRSTDGGRTWSEPVALSGESRSVFGQTLVRAGDRLLLVWQDTLGGQDRIYSSASSDAGATWTPPTRVDHLPDGGPAASSASAVLGDTGEALVAWQDARNGREDIFLARSTDGGRTWAPQDQRMDTDDPGTGISRFPKLAKSPDGRVAIAWEDDRAGYESVFMRVRSAGAKPEWGPEIAVAPVSGKLAARVPELTWAPDGVYVTWQVWDNALAPSRIDKHVASRTFRPN